MVLHPSPASPKVKPSQRLLSAPPSYYAVALLSVLLCVGFTFQDAFKSRRNVKIRIITVSDKFKGTLTAEEVGKAIFEGIKAGNTNKSYTFEHLNIQISDGGDGYLDSLKSPLHLAILEHVVLDSHGQDKRVKYGINHEERYAVVEMAQVVGLAHLKTFERNPLRTSTYGLGQLIEYIRHTHHVERMLLGVGGSSTNDAGFGALQAMGYKITMRDGKIRPTDEVLYGRDVEDIMDVSPPDGLEWGKYPVKIDISCDVTNPFIGADGATRVYGPQKGASPPVVSMLEAAMTRINEIIYNNTNIDLSKLNGTGAAGGISGSFHALLGSNLQRGIELVCRYANVERILERSQENTVVFSGEGAYDSQSMQGKVVSHIEDLCTKYNKTFYLVVGRSEMQRNNLISLVDYYPEHECMNDSYAVLKDVITQTFPDINHPSLHAHLNSTRVEAPGRAYETRE